MKKLFFTLGTTLLLNAVYAQNGKVTSAWSAMQAYVNDHDVHSLETGLPYIDAAVKDSATSKSTKAWWYRAQLYLYVSNEPELAKKFPDATTESLNSFKKMVELNDPKFKSWSEVNEKMGELATVIFNNEGVAEYTSKQYEKATASFLRVVTLDSLLKLKGGEMPQGLSVALNYAGMSALSANALPQAAGIYERLIAQSPDSAKYYNTLYEIYTHQDKKAEALAVVDKGLAKDPKNYNLLLAKANSYLVDNKGAEAIDYLKKMIEQDPKNEQLVSILGDCYQNAKDTANAIKTYQSLLNVNPDSYDGNRGMGALWVNQTKQLQEQINALGTSKADMEKEKVLTAQRNKYFVLAKPYLEKALAAKPDDENTKSALTKIKVLLGE